MNIGLYNAIQAKVLLMYNISIRFERQLKKDIWAQFLLLPYPY